MAQNIALLGEVEAMQRQVATLRAPTERELTERGLRERERTVLLQAQGPTAVPEASAPQQDVARARAPARPGAARDGRSTASRR